MNGLSLIIYLLSGYENRFVDDDPSDSLLTAGNRERSFVCHIELEVRNQIPNRQRFDRDVLFCGEEIMMRSPCHKFDRTSFIKDSLMF